MPETQGRVSTATFTPAAAAYAAGDVIEGAKEFVGAGGMLGGEVKIASAELEVDASAVQAGETSYRLYLYAVTPPSAPADNAAWDLPTGDRAAWRGYVDLGTPVDLGSTLWVETHNLHKHVTVPSGGSLFGLLVTNGAFTATAVARKVTLHTLRV
jgi:hypothetical protein